MITWAYYLGFARTVYSLTSISPVIVLGFLFLAGVYMALRGGLSAAASTALVIGFTNIILLVIIIAIALPHMKPGNLSYVNIPSFSTILGQREILASILGVILMTYFGHMSVSVCSRMALEREPGGRSLQWGAMTAQFVAMIFNVLWVLAVYGAVSRQAILDDIASTSLTPLSAEVGLLVKLLGSAFVILGMGMGAIRDPFYLSQLMLSFLPKRSKKTIILPRRRGQLILAGKKNQAPGQTLTLTYLGLRDNLPLLRLDINTDGSGNPSATRHHEFTLDEKWSIESHEPGCANLKIEALQSSPANLSLTLETAYSVSYRGEWDNTGLAVASLLDMEGSQKNLLNWMIRKVEFRMRDLQEYLGQDEANAALALQLIQDEGWVGKLDNSADPLYQVYFSPGKKRRAPEAVWKALDGIDTPARSVAPAAKKASQTPPWLLSFFYSKVGALVLSLLPGVIVLLFSLWSLVTPGVSFSIILGVAGIIVGALLTGIIPALLIAISRKKGDRTPGVVYGFLGNPVYLIAIFLFSWFNILAHGLIIWEGFFQRGIALLVCAFFAFMTYRLFRQGAFRTSFVIEVIMDTREDGPATISFFNGGVPAETSLRLETAAEVFEYRVSSLPLPDLATLRKLTVNIPAEAAGDLLVWARKINQDGHVESIPGRLEFEDGSATCSHDLAQAADRLQLHSRANCQVEIIPA